MPSVPRQMIKQAKFTFSFIEKHFKNKQRQLKSKKLNNYMLLWIQKKITGFNQWRREFIFKTKKDAGQISWKVIEQDVRIKWKNKLWWFNISLQK